MYPIVLPVIKAGYINAALVLNRLEGIEHDVNENLLHVGIFRLNQGDGFAGHVPHRNLTVRPLAVENLHTIFQHLVDVDEGTTVLLAHLAERQHLLDGVVDALYLPHNGIQQLPAALSQLAAPLKQGNAAANVH